MPLPQGTSKALMPAPLSSRGTRNRSQSASNRPPRKLLPWTPCAAGLKDSFAESLAMPAVPLALPAPVAPMRPPQLHARDSGNLSSSSAVTLEEFVQTDLDAFWKWCPASCDGLHRCALLAKLFDYCGLTHKHDKVSEQLLRLNRELSRLGVVGPEEIQAHQRVSYEAFVRSTQLRDAVARCGPVASMWDHLVRRGGLGTRASEEDTPPPLAVWVGQIIAPTHRSMEHREHLAAGTGTALRPQAPEQLRAPRSAAARARQEGREQAMVALVR